MSTTTITREALRVFIGLAVELTFLRTELIPGLDTIYKAHMATLVTRMVIWRELNDLPATATAIGKALQMPRPTLLRYLKMLERKEIIVREGRRYRYNLEHKDAKKFHEWNTRAFKLLLDAAAELERLTNKPSKMDDPKIVHFGRM